ncbi:Uncharacterised protein [Mycolicibacterium smegmatis]|jgi:hypothetical protein|uniref:Uncharacterized protein n=1 Tax=Mycolicibacterium smegmatis (strain MKD8) TaxID=1214915 RepID=A0A2U9PR15_MYCSE|nr:hypothetical protein D806_032480 [Mycolicibacterium smegmatis MKD8]CKH88505.1 Uncharacterised protein [Mycolicibacterium smegmatis]SUA34555.1 Uncharacterised protein [Mycolicibacterium smegmatis]VTP08148.1 hypothetical protein BIN_B_02472 [Mycolicibacterium smegmatis]
MRSGEPARQRPAHPPLPDGKALRRKAIRSIWITLVLLTALAATAIVAVC